MLFVFHRKYVYTLCPKSLGPLLYTKFLHKMGQDFFDIQYTIDTTTLTPDKNIWSVRTVTDTDSHQQIWIFVG